MLINVAQEEECRIAIIEGGKLDELYFERAANLSHVGNIYKGKITNIEPSIQACFIDFGIGQNGFLHISDVQTIFFPKNKKKERVGQKRPRRERPPIQDCLKRGQEIMVQVIKDGIGTKGPTLTTYISIPGRYLVLMPGMNRSGVSRKIEDDESRLKLKTLLKEMTIPEDVGVIVRTAGLGRTKRDLQRDINYLGRLWKTVNTTYKKESAPVELYGESDLVIRTIRDVFNADITKITCDSEATVKQVKGFLRIAVPRSRCRISLFDDKVPLFTKYKIEQEIANMQARQVLLPSGGSLVIDQTEALVAIDINSGKNRAHTDSDVMAYNNNLEAAEEIARQLRLRDLGGVIVVDFIDMLHEKHRRGVDRKFKELIGKDRARTKVLRISQLGLVEMTRQRMRPSLERSHYEECPNCGGMGKVKSVESMALNVMRRIQTAIGKDRVTTIDVEVAPAVAYYLQNKKRSNLYDLEHSKDKVIEIRGNVDFLSTQSEIIAQDSRGSVVSRNF